MRPHYLEVATNPTIDDWVDQAVEHGQEVSHQVTVHEHPIIVRTLEQQKIVSKLHQQRKHLQGEPAQRKETQNENENLDDLTKYNIKGNFGY